MKLSRLPFLLSLLMVVSLACSMPALAPERATPVAVSQLTPGVPQNPGANPTATPFQPATTASSLEGTPEPEILPTITPTVDPSTPTPVPMIDRYERPDGQVHILLLGSDFRPGAGYRTDVMLLVVLNPRKGKASVISFPRDLYVNIPGWQMQRINTAQQHGGFETTVATFEENFGITPDHYVMTNMAGFRGIIDTLGGINIYASRSLYDYCDLPFEDADGKCYIGEGSHPMNGETALWYVRSRYSTSDFDRLRRAQEVIQGIFLKMLSLNAVARAPELYNLFGSSVETDLGLNDILPLLSMVSKLNDTSSIERYAIDREYVTSWTTDQGASVLLPNTDSIWKLFSKVVYDVEE